MPFKHPKFSEIDNPQEMVCSHCGRKTKTTIEFVMEILGPERYAKEILEKVGKTDIPPANFCEHCNMAVRTCTKEEFREKMDYVIRCCLSIRKVSSGMYDTLIPGDWTTRESWEEWCAMSYEEQVEMCMKVVALNHVMKDDANAEVPEDLPGRIFLDITKQDILREEHFSYFVK